MTKAHDQGVRDEADAELRYQQGKSPAKKAVEEPVNMRVPKIDLSPLAAGAPESGATPYVQAALTDPETKKLFEALIDEIRRQVAAGGGGGGGGGVPQSVVSDLNSLRDAIMLTNASLDADAGVATDTFAANGDPPPITTVAS